MPQTMLTPRLMRHPQQGARDTREVRRADEPRKSSPDGLTPKQQEDIARGVGRIGETIVGSIGGIIGGGRPAPPPPPPRNTMMPIVVVGVVVLVFLVTRKKLG